jgi:NAD(P)-dependent dehydrogenase (short-subunit alcohol dehydrogenase family)
VDIESKAAVVSGGASGIGRATVLALVERGAKVVVADVDEDAMFCRCDVTKTEELASAFGLATERFGRLDIAFNNAGVGGEDLFADDPGDWKRVVDIDLVAVIDATRLAVREMRRAGIRDGLAAPLCHGVYVLVWTPPRELRRTPSRNCLESSRRPLPAPLWRQEAPESGLLQPLLAPFGP